MRLSSSLRMLGLVLLTGCASIQPVLNPTEAADPKCGYVAGLFTRMKMEGFAFVIKSLDREEEYTMPLGEDSALPTAVANQTVAIKLPPGRYAVQKWITYATLTKEIMKQKPITNPILSQPFTVTAGEVVHLGSYDVYKFSEGGYLHWRIQPRAVTKVDVMKGFASTYANLAPLPLRCVVCMETAPQSPSLTSAPPTR